MKSILTAVLLATSVLTGMAATASAFTVVGNGGGDTLPDGSVGLPPDNNASVFYVSTNGGISGVGANPDGSSFSPTNGSTFTTGAFTPGAGGTTSFNFFYISSDGNSGGNSFPDNAWADVIDVTTNTVAATLYSSTTTAFVPLAGTSASVLGGSSGTCFGTGCGNTGWQSAGFTFANGDTYQLEFGVVNSRDTQFDSALFFDGVIVNGQQILAPEPATVGLFGLALVGLAGLRRRRG